MLSRQLPLALLSGLALTAALVATPSRAATPSRTAAPPAPAKPAPPAFEEIAKIDAHSHVLTPPRSSR